MVPIYFHYMSVSTYGAWLATGNMVAMLGLLESGFSSVITQKMAAAIGSGNKEGYGRLAGANIVTAIIIATAILLVGLSISPFIADWINVDGSVVNDIRLAYIIALLASSIAILVSLFGAFPQVWQDTKAVGMINICTGLLSIASLVAFLLFGFGVLSIAMSYLVRALLNLILQGTWILRKWRHESIQPPTYSISETKLLAKDCIFPFFSKLSGVLMGNSQSFIIAHFMNPALAAVYDITSKVCYVACGFVSQTNGSFFALFSLTLSSGDKEKIRSVFRNTTQFFAISLALIGLYSICFTEPIINYWVGLDKYGGTKLLIIIVIAKMVFQFRAYCNNILYTGGMINKSVKLDILCAIVYIGILFVIIKAVQIYAIPLATLVVSLLFIGWYLKLIKKHLALDARMLIWEFSRSMFVILPFVIIHYTLNFDYKNIYMYIGYFIIFSIVYAFVLYMTNIKFFRSLLSKTRNR